MTCLRAQNNSTLFQKKCEIAGKIEASCDPSSLRNIKLGSTFILKTFQIPNRFSERVGVGSFAIADTSELGDRNHVLPWWAIREEAGAGFRIESGLGVTGEGQ